MIIKKLSLNNFMCYYDLKTFEFADGLNIILGHNGDGKSTIFRAFNWIFETHSNINLNEVFSKKKFAEISDNENLLVYVECVISQYDSEYKITKSFEVEKISGNPIVSRIKEEVWRKDLSTGDVFPDNRNISSLSQQVFPEAFRNFSMFETETDALRIVEGEKLADLVRNFSNARHYDKLNAVVSEFAVKADRQFRKESNSDKAIQEAIEGIDVKIIRLRKDIETLNLRISEDESGRDFYTIKINELVRNLSISEEYKKIEAEIEMLKDEIDKARSENKIRNKFTDRIFDDFYILKGFDEVLKDFSVKTNELRLLKNKVDNFERNKFAVEKLELENNSTPLPPGFPSLEILNEILSDKICKICNTQLNDNSATYINKSIKLYEESKIVEKELEMPLIFPNNFIDEFQIIDRIIKLKPEKYSTERIVEEIDFALKRIKECNLTITNNNRRLDQLEVYKKELLDKVTSLSENELKNVLSNHEKFTQERDELVTNISENKTRLEWKMLEVLELEKTRRKTLAQFKDSDFKQTTLEILAAISRTAESVKDAEYEKFLKELSHVATNYLEQINIGEITGKIVLYKKNDKEVSYRSYNHDDSVRSSLEDSGAVEISKPLSILFAISDLASRSVDNETYPMIFDAPTGRFSPDREREFFKLLKKSKKQRIVVTFKFLESDANNVPYVNSDIFQNIEKDKAFFIKRVRPYEKDKPETINTEIELI